MKELTLLPADTLASLSVLPESDKAKEMTATSGRKYSELLKRQDPVGCCVKMLLDTSRWASTKCFLTWEAKATPENRLLFQLVPKTPNTDAIESGLLPTPAARDFKGARGKAAQERKGNPSDTLPNWIRNQFLATPQAGDDRDRGGTSNPSIQRRIKIGKQINLSMNWDGPMNPRFVEELMGYPAGWTEIDSED